MFSIIEHIEYLMASHDCVVVPGWGAFIANYAASRYDAGRQLMLRPQRTVSFNASVTHNDGLLAQSLMRREGMTFDEAMRFIADSVTTFSQQLKGDGEVSVGRLGYFSRRQGRYNEFVPFVNANASDRYFGLADLDVKTVEALEQERALQEQEAAAVAAIAGERRNLFSRRATRIAASVAVLVGLGVVLSTPIIVDRSHDMASMTTSVTAPRSQQLGMTVEQGVASSGIQVVESCPGIAAAGNTAGKYYMVIATLRNQQELDAFKVKYHSLVPYMKMLDYKGMMCVYVARSDDYGQLMGLRDELPQPLRDIWIYN